MASANLEATSPSHQHRGTVVFLMYYTLNSTVYFRCPVKKTEEKTPSPNYRDGTSGHDSFAYMGSVSTLRNKMPKEYMITSKSTSDHTSDRMV